MSDTPPSSSPPADHALAAPKSRKRSRVRKFVAFLLILAVILSAVRLALPSWARWYVNQTLSKSPSYTGKIGAVDIHLLRGGYTINDVRLNQNTGNVPVPLFAAKRIDLTLQWSALLSGKLVGKVAMIEPQLNFVAGNDQSSNQTGAGGPWLQMLTDLFPFKINSVTLHDGSIHFRAFHSTPPVDVYLSHLNAQVDNLTNIHDDVAPLITTVSADGLAMDQAKFQYKMKLDPFSYKPTFQLALRLVGLDVTKTNDLTRAYGAFDFQSGFFDLVIELDSKEGVLTGYIKPLFRHIKVFDLRKDAAQDNPLGLFWEALVGLTTQVLKNPPRDQFGTNIPLTGDLSAPKPDILTTLGNVFYNAFVRAFLPRLDRTNPDADNLHFGPAAVTDPDSISDQP